MSAHLLDIQGLKVHFKTDDGMVRAVDGVDIAVDRGETVSVVGESGCGKTVTAKTILKLIDMPPGRIVAGSIMWQGRDIVPLGPDQMRAIRAKEIGFVFQEPMTSLNPVYTVGEQIAETVRQHERLSRRAALDRAAEMLRLVNIPSPRQRVHDYPHQFSGGMRQRVMIADGAGLRPEAADRGRADHRARRDDPGADPRPAERDEGTPRHGGPADHPCDGRGGGDGAARRRHVCRQGGGGSGRGRAVRTASAPLHQGLIRSIPRLDLAATEHRRLEAIPGTVPAC
jgi:peptide/nickel transport system ATP-binding protein